MRHAHYWACAYNLAVSAKPHGIEVIFFEVISFCIVDLHAIVEIFF